MADTSLSAANDGQPDLAALGDTPLAQLADLFRLLGDPTRLRILLSCMAAPVAVGTIAERSGASPSLVSHHLRLLRAARLVRSERRGRQVFYAPCDDHIRCVIEDMVAHVDEPDGAEEADG